MLAVRAAGLTRPARPLGRAYFPIPPHPPGCYGVNIHWPEHNENPRSGVVRMIAAAGFHWVRTGLMWSHTEQTAGHYDFQAYDNLMTVLRRYHLRALFILCYGNPLYTGADRNPPITARQRHAFCRWVAAAVRHFKGHGIIWEMWNEPNGNFWQHLGGPWSHWGGANNGVLNFPVAQVALGVNNARSAKTVGTADFSCITFTARAKPPANLRLFSGRQPWKFWNGAEFPGAKGSFQLAQVHGQRAGVLSYNFSGGGRYVDAITRLSIAHAGALRFAMRSATPQSVLVRITDHTGQTLQFYRAYDSIGHWRYFHINLGPWPAAGTRYARLAADVGRTIRRVAPREMYVGPALAGAGDLNFLERCFQSGALGYWNAVTVHPYRPGGPESVVADYAAIRKLIAPYALPGQCLPLLSGEWGYSSTWYHGNNSKQARYAARELLVNLWQHIPLSIYYDWHNDGPDSRNAEDNFGLVRFAYHPGHKPVYTPKPAYLAVKTMGGQLRDCHCLGRLSLGRSNDYILRFAGPGGERIVVWKTGQQPQTVFLPLKSGRWRITNYIGTRVRTVLVASGIYGLKLRISHDPQYLSQ